MRDLVEDYLRTNYPACRADGNIKRLFRLKGGFGYLLNNVYLDDEDFLSKRRLRAKINRLIK